MARIRGLHGDVKGLVFEIKNDETSIGRLDSNTLVLADRSVSGAHCVIVRNGKKYLIRDLGSTNGTCVNSVPVMEQELASGNLLKIGHVELLIEGDDIKSDVKDRNTPVPVRPTRLSGSGEASTPVAAGFKQGSRYGVKALLAVVIIAAIVGIIGAVVVLIRLFGAG